MTKRLLMLLLFCAPAFASIPVRNCTASGTTTTSCSITVAQHHLTATIIFTSGDVSDLSYSDTLGNSATQNPFFGCFPGGPACNAGVGMAQSYSIAFASQSSVLFYISTGSSSGSVTFTVSTASVGTGVVIYTAEYGEDLNGVDVGAQTGTTLTTLGANDLIIVMTGDSGVTTCSSITPASGFTLEFTQLSSCKSYSDRIDLPPGTYSYRATLTGSAAPGWSAIAFGVTPVTSAVRHRSQIY